MITEVSAEDLRLELIKDFRRFAECEGSGQNWFNKRKTLWMKYVISREIYLRQMEKLSGNPYRPPNVDFDSQMKHFVETHNH